MINRCLSGVQVRIRFLIRLLRSGHAAQQQKNLHIAVLSWFAVVLRNHSAHSRSELMEVHSFVSPCS